MLARDNAERLCTVCQSMRRRDRAPHVPAEFWDDDVMVDALASGDFGRVLRAYRQHPFHGRPLSQAVVAGWLHVSQASLSRIELGQCRLTVDDIAGFAGCLGLSVALRWVHQYPSEARQDVDPLSRRSLFGTGIATALGGGVTNTPAAAREIDPGLVQHWMALVSVLSRHDAMFGPRDVRNTVQRELGLVAEHRQLARGHLALQLLRVESHWTQLAAWLSNDTGQVRGRDALTDRTVRLAEEAGYPDMIAYVRRRQSQWAAESLDARRTITFAEAALRVPGTSDQTRALCAFKAALGHALARDTASCERSLADAQGLLEHAATSEPATPWGNLGGHDVSPAYALAGEARCWLWLQPRKAITLYEHALREWPRDRTRDGGLHRARLALACAAAGEPERAATEGLDALAIARSTRSDLNMRELRRLDHQLAACDVAAVGDFREAFAAL